jgi:hypothetical protein
MCFIEAKFINLQILYIWNKFPQYVITFLLRLNWPFNAERLIKTSGSEPFKIKIPSKNVREKPTNTPIIHSVY